MGFDLVHTYQLDFLNGVLPEVRVDIHIFSKKMWKDLNWLNFQYSQGLYGKNKLLSMQFQIIKFHTHLDPRCSR